MFDFLNIKKESYSSKIKFYYLNDIDLNLVNEMIDILVYNKKIENYDKQLLKKRENNNEVIKLKNNKTYYVKTYHPFRKKKLIKNLFRPTEAVRHLTKTKMLKNRSIPIFDPICAVTIKKSFFSYKSIFITEAIPGITLDFFFKESF